MTKRRGNSTENIQAGVVELDLPFRNVVLQVESVIIKANLFFSINKTRIFLAQFKEFSASFIKPDLFPSNPMVDIKKMFTFSSKSKLQLNYFSPAGVRMLVGSGKLMINILTVRNMKYVA